MSFSRTPNTNVVPLLAVLAVLLSGCGSQPGSEGSKPPSQRDLSGALEPTGAAPQAAEDSPSTPQEPAPERQGSAPEATDFAPVDIDLRDGAFAKGTPRSFHLPSGFIIVVRVRADEQGPYRLRVRSPSMAQSFTIAPNRQQHITLDSMRSGQTAELMLNGRTVVIAADADPGP